MKLRSNVFKSSFESRLANQKGFTLIEMLIVITIIGVLAAIVAGALGDLGGKKARDAIRISDLSQIATMASSLQNRFHVPPFSKVDSKYPDSCDKGQTDLRKCFLDLQMASESDLDELLSDPKQDTNVGESSAQFKYYYGAKTNGFKVCAYLEDQGAFENLNADSDGTITTSLDPSKDSAYMHCVVRGTGVDDLKPNAIEIGT